MAKDCPHCNVTNPSGAQRCDCGYDFGRGTVGDSYLSNKDHVQRAREAQADDEGRRAFGLLFRLFRLFR
jgi:hypothetical protein